MKVPVSDIIGKSPRKTVCCLIWPWAHTKLPKINQVMEHYQGIVMNGKVVDINEYRKAMSLE